MTDASDIVNRNAKSETCKPIVIIAPNVKNNSSIGPLRNQGLPSCCVLHFLSSTVHYDIDNNVCSILVHACMHHLMSACGVSGN